MQRSPSDARRSRKSSAKVARNICKFPEILTRRAQRNCLKSASMRCVNRRTSPKLFTESAVRPNAKKCASGVDVTQILRQTRAKKLQNFWKSGAPRAQKLRALGRRSAAHALKNVAEVYRVDNAFRSKKARVRRRDHANVAPKSRERNAKISKKKFSALRAQEVACTRPACAATRMTSSNLFTKS